jgi:hypothetical protein
MAITKASDFQIYEEQFFGGFNEKLKQNTDAFNADSAGTIVLKSKTMKGNYEQESFFSSIASLVTRQDITSVAAATDLIFDQNEIARVKLHRKIGPVAYTLKSFKQAGLSPEMASFVLGEQAAKAVMVEQINSALAAAANAMVTNTNILNDVSGASGTCTFTNLIGTLRKFGDAHQNIQAWVMHSTQWFDLGLDAVAESVDSVVSDIVRVFNVPTLGKRVVVTDSASLIKTADTPDSYYVLGLVPNAVSCVETEAETMVMDLVSGLEQIAYRLQGEYAYNLGLKGYTWDIANGGANPSAANLATGSNWDKVAADDKDTSGVILKCIAA